MTLKDVKTGQTVTVQKINGEGAIKKRIMEGWMPKNVSTQQILTNKNPLSWKEQEEMIV